MAAVLDGFSELEPHPDAGPAFRRLRKADIRVAALTNGSSKVVEKLLQRSGLEKSVERLISIEEVQHWKPRREVYLHAARSLGVEPQHVALAAAHAWDIHGAGRAGLTTAYVARGTPFPSTMMPPHFTANTLFEIADTIAMLPPQT